jgi:MFS family permease
MIPVSASLAVAGPLSGWFSDRFGPRPFLVAGLIVSAIGFMWLMTIGPDDSFLALAPALVLVGGGSGLFAAPNRAAMMTAVPPTRRGVASGIGSTLLNTGSTVSLGLTLVIMTSVLTRPEIQAIFLGSAASGGSFHAGAGFLDAIHLIFGISAALIVAALIPTVARGATPPPPAAPQDDID